MNRDKKDLAYEQVDEVMRSHRITRDEYKQKWGILRGQLMRRKGNQLSQELEQILNIHPLGNGTR